MTIPNETPAAPATLSDYIVLVWHIEDVQTVRPDLTEAQCRVVLQQVKRKHDAEIGVHWGVLAEHADLLYGAPPEDDATVHRPDEETA